MVENAWQEARVLKPEMLLFCAFQFDEEAGLAIYQVLLTWEEINLPAPWYDYLSIDLVATRGATYPRVAGNTWRSPYESLQAGEDFETSRARGGGIFHPPTVATQGFKAIRCE